MHFKDIGNILFLMSHGKYLSSFLSLVYFYICKLFNNKFFEIKNKNVIDICSCFPMARTQSYVHIYPQERLQIQYRFAPKNRKWVCSSTVSLSKSLFLLQNINVTIFHTQNTFIPSLNMTTQSLFLSLLPVQNQALQMMYNSSHQEERLSSNQNRQECI